jgi:predicted nucleotide-binding protein
MISSLTWMVGLAERINALIYAVICATLSCELSLMQHLPTTPRPKIFIGSSSEQIQTARTLGEMLSACADAVVWDEYHWTLNESVFGNLLNAADGFDFAVFVFAGDDFATIRNSDISIVRDNVVFELGLFLGRMGRERAWWLSPEGSAKPHTLTDLEGVVHLTYILPTDADFSSLQQSLVKAHVFEYFDSSLRF